MAQPLNEWVAEEVAPFRDRPVQWLSGEHFFRDPSRAVTVDHSYFLSPADGIILYQGVVEPDDAVLDVKGRPYSVQNMLRTKIDEPCYVVGVFMTFYDVHINRIPYAGVKSYRELPPLTTVNRPMLNVEKSLIEQLRIPTDSFDYLHANQRVVASIFAPTLRQHYYVAQIADYDVDHIVQFRTDMNAPYRQGQRYGQIRYGSQCELVIPCQHLTLNPCHPTGWHVKAGVDKLVEIGVDN